MNDLFNSKKFIVAATIIGILVGVPVNLFIANFAIGRVIIATGIIFTIGYSILQFMVVKGYLNLGWWGDIQRQIVVSITKPSKLYMGMNILIFLIVAIGFGYMGHIKIAIGTILAIMIPTMLSQHYKYNTTTEE